MSSGMSVTDIAAKVSLDYSAYMQGIKVIESRAVDMAKAIANPNYPSPIPDVGASHVDDYVKDLISADERTTAIIVANRQKIYAFDKEAHAYRIRAAKETAVLEKQRADAAAIEAQRVAAMHQYDQQRRKQEADDIAEASEKLRMRMERDAKLQASIDSLFSSQKLKLEEQAHAGDRIYFLAKRQAEEYARLLSTIQEIYRVESMSGAITTTRIQELVKLHYDFKKLQQDEMDFEVNAKTAKEAEKRKAIETQIVSLLDQQKAKNDEIYAQHLRDRKARSEFARLLLEARKAGVPNATLQPLVQDFNYAQVEQQRTRQNEKDIAVLNNLSKARKQDAQVMAYRKHLQEEDVALQKRAEQILRSLMTAQDLHNERVKEYTMLLGKGKFTQEQFNDAVEASKRVMTASNAGAGRFSGAMTQLSFAAEDFIQVSAMGGGLNMALMSASNNMSMFVRAMLPAAGLLSSLAGAVVPLAAIGIGMYVQRTMQAKDSTEALNKELERFLRNAQQDLRLQALFSFEDTQNVSSASEAMSRAADASREMKKAQLEQKLTQNAVNSSLESFIMSLEEARKLTNAPLASEEFEYYQMAFEEYKRAFNEVMNSGMKTEQDARTALTRYMTSLSQYPTIFAEQIDLIRKILNDPEGNALEAFRQLEEQNARLFNAQQEMEESRKRALDLARQELQMRQEEEMLVLRMNEEEKQRYDLAKQQKEFIGFDPMAVAGLGLAGILNAGQGMAAGMQFLEAQAANLEKEIAALQQSSSPEVIGGMQQDAFQAQADAFKQIFAAENKQPNPQLTRQIQLLTDIRAAMAAGGTIKVVGQ